MPDRHDQFIHDENILNFELKLRAETDPARRVRLEAMLATERARKPLPAPPPKLD